MLSYAAVEASRDSASASPPSSSHGVASLSGRLRKQEDRFRIARPLSAPALQHAGDGEEEGSCVRGARLLKGLHLYAVYDGHGGSDVSQHCSERLHAHLASLLASGRALDRSHSTATTSTTSDCGSPNSTRTALPPPQRAPLLRACSVGAPALLASNCSAFSFLPAAGGRQWPGCGGGATGASTGSGGNAKDKGQQAAGEAGEDDADVAVVSAALRAAFAACDRELAGTDAGEFVGSTAVVALVGRRHIWVAHCGDSRAALLRAGTACALTADHKPDREDEASRIRSCGGRVVFNGGSPRVMGMLAMSRSIGDHYLRPYVIAEPEVVCLRRSPDDELLILATDGLWDVLRCADAANLASRRIASCRAGTADGNQPSTCASAPADAASAALLDPCQEAASALAQAAVDRGSRDDITVVVVDVSLGAAPATKAAAAACDAVAVGAAGAAGAGDGSGTPRTRSDGEEGPLAGGSPALGRGLLRACSGVPCMAPFGASPVHAASPPQQAAAAAAAAQLMRNRRLGVPRGHGWVAGRGTVGTRWYGGWGAQEPRWAAGGRGCGRM